MGAAVGKLWNQLGLECGTGDVQDMDRRAYIQRHPSFFGLYVACGRMDYAVFLCIERREI